MPRNIFITGLPKSGKTTLLQKLIEELKKRGRKIGGFISPALVEHGTREGFYVQDIETGKTALLASLSSGGPKVSKYCVKIKDFESIALPAMSRVDRYDVFVLDEIGRMEMKSRKFTDMLDRIFESNTLVIASIAEDYAPVYGFQGEIILLTPTNREGVFMELLKKALEVPSVREIRKAEVVGEAPEEKKAKRISGKKKQPAAIKKGRRGEKKKTAVKPRAEKKETAAGKKEAEERPASAAERKGFMQKIKDLLGF